MGLLYLARALAPGMVERGGGAIVATGNTSAFRGTANYAAFAPTKAAQRILAESLARNLGPKGVHVAYLMIDAVINVPWTRGLFPNEDDSFFIEPSSIAQEVWHLCHQPRDAWAFNAEVRPYREKW
jgi:short-subunit dehydrogenase